MKTQYTNSITDSQTGEVLATETHVEYDDDEKIPPEEPYSKVYEKAARKYKLPRLLLGFLSVFSEYCDYLNNDEMYMVLKIDKSNRDNIKEDLEVSEPTLKRLTKMSLDYGLLFPTSHSREFIINPYFFGKGRWANIYKSRKHFFYDLEKNKWFMYE